MKKRHWLDITETFVLVGSGVGSVAAVVAQQVVYATVPLTFLVVLNVANRRRFEQETQQNADITVLQLNQQLSSGMEGLQSEVQALPTFDDLKKSRKVILQETHEAIATLQKSVAQQLAPFSEPEISLIQQEIAHLQERYGHLAESLESVTSYLPRLATSAKVLSLETHFTQLSRETTQLRSETEQLRTKLQAVAQEPKVMLRLLQEQVSHLNRRLNSLPMPFDASGLRQDVESLIKVVAELVPRRELNALSLQLEQLHRQHHSLQRSTVPLKMSISILRKQVETLNGKLTSSDVGVPAEAQVLAELQAQIDLLEERLQQLPTYDQVEQLRTDLQTAFTTDMSQLQQQVTRLQQTTQALEQRQQVLRDWVKRLPQVLDTSAFKSQLQRLTVRVEASEQELLTLQSQIEATVQGKLDKLNQQLQAAPVTAEYQLVFALKDSPVQKEVSPDLLGSRAILIQALAQTRSHLIAVWTNPHQCCLDETLLQHLKQFLDRQGRLEIGWGHLGDHNPEQNYLYIDPISANPSFNRNEIYQTLHQLSQLKRDYPQQFKFKILGTEENFIVSDRAVGILGVQTLTTTNTVFPELELGLQTTDASIIQGLITRFNAPDLQPGDVVAHLNRAATRYELGDKQGALADYVQILQHDPHQAIAYNNQGVILYNLGDPRGAIAVFDQALQMNHHHPVTYCNRGLVKAGLGDKLGAIEDYSHAIQLDPGVAVAYFHRGLSRTRLGNKLGAIADYSEVIRIDPNSAMAYFYRGLARTKLGDTQSALEDLEKAAQLFTHQGDRSNTQKALKMLTKLQRLKLEESASA